MANLDARFGLKPVRHLNGSPWNGQTIKCYVSSNYAVALFAGDPVDLDTATANKNASAIYQTVIKATAGDGNRILGSIVGVVPDFDDLTKTYIPASTGGYVNVAIASPDLVYQIRDDGATLLTSTVVGQNANLIYTHPGNTSTGLSGVELDTTSDPPEANASNQLLVLGLSDMPDNSLAIHAVWDVLINMPRFGATGDGDGALGVTAS